MSQNLGDYYAGKKYYFEAITEYKRQLFTKDYTNKDKVLYKISLLYFRSNRKVKAETYLTQAIFNKKHTDYDINCYILAAKIHWDNYDYKIFRNTLTQLQTTLDSGRCDTLEYIKAWSYYYNAQWKQGNQIIDSLNLSFSDSLLADINRIAHIPQKSKVLAGIMSTILPGSGNLYAGDHKNALLTFGLVGSIGGSIIWNIIKRAYFVAASKYLFLFRRYYKGSRKNLLHKIEKENVSRIGDYLKSISSHYPDPIKKLQEMKKISDRNLFENK